ncbi:MAG: TonB-dependent receptor plug domain-containing protein [Ignavibacteriales bacterium]|nr:TonB-dependent receptor plug domain-containing protein [Ignavibacteriales bacterium]
MGSITEGIDSAGMFHRSQLIWTDAKYFGDLAWQIPGFFLTDLGEVGKPNFLSASGVGGTGVSILLDGRPLNDPITGLFNLYDIPMEFIEQVEVSQGSPGFLFGNGGTSATLNFVTRQFNSLRPITKIRYVQSQSETILTDVLFTQNVARSLNLMIAFQRHVSDGRYTNSVLDAWNLRTRLRYNVSDRLNISLTDFYTKTFNGLNGGVNLVTTSTIFDNVAASVNYEEASERIARRDVTLSVIGKPFGDSSSVSQLSLYYSQLDREYRDQAVTYTNFQNASFIGARLTQRFVAGVGDVLAGFDYQQQEAESITLGNRTTSFTAFFGKIAINLGDILTPSFFARYEVTRSQPSLGFGSNVTLSLSQGLQAFAGFNQFISFSTLMETYSSDTSIIRSSSVNNRRQRLAEAGLRLMPDSSVAISITGFRRSIQDASGFLSSPAIAPLYPKVEVIGPFDAQIQGITGSIRLRFWKMEGYGTLTFTDYRQADTAKTLTPKFVLAGELSYRDRFFEDALDARFGLRSRFVSEHRGFQFIPHLHLFAENRGPQPGQFSTVDVFAILRIGDAYISLAWENLLNTNYFISPVSPLPGRNFRFGVDWVFID